MRSVRISRGGQISVPAEVRRRWQTDRLALDDRGDQLILRPIPADPIGAARGSLAGPGPTSDQVRSRIRREEASSGRDAR
jgi:bifunctional DNA-binding transcriptional regulator/antitoxin component of YhaV-PrlF toxin-antitoxin module